MPDITVVTGGARSGKSKFAEELCKKLGQSPCYIATAQSFDEEMEQRIARHRSRRGESWHTIEEPLMLPQTLAGIDGNYSCILVDCLTIWLSNMLLSFEKIDPDTEDLIRGNVHRLKLTLRTMSTPVVLVTNEVGMGIVPENQLARAFRDLAGETNQIIAASADHVYAIISGLPLKLK
jgi:adenosylcobinamide kinase/adenosylcobinamide-phosphate guanylyltransferase